MRSRHSRTTLIAAFDSTATMPDRSVIGSGAMFLDESVSSTTREPELNLEKFSSLIRLALRNDKKSPLSRTMTTLLGLSKGDEVILTKQIGITEGDNLHGLIVSLKPNADDIILVAKRNTMMEIYLTDSCCRLRAAAILQRDSDEPELVRNMHAVVAFARELNAWNILATKMNH